MKFSLGFGGRTGVGIDIGSSFIKILRLSISGNKFYADDMDVITLPEGSITNGIINDPAPVASYIKSSILRLGIKEKNVVISLPCRHVIIKTINMPKMKDSELSASLYYEAQQYITYDINEVSYDYIVMGESPSAPGNNSVMIVAGKKDIIENRNELIHECGLNPFIMDVDCIAIENMFNFNYPEDFDDIICVAEIGASETSVHIIRKGANIFRRDIPIGGISITEEIAKRFQLNFTEAENIKTGVSVKEEDGFKESYSTFLDILTSRITSEIQRTIDYFAANNDRQYPRKIYLAGGSSVLKGFSKDLESRLNIPVELLNPLRNILFSPKNASVKEQMEVNFHFLNIAVGLALRGLEKE